MTLARREDLLRDQLAHLPFGSRRTGDAPVRLGVVGSGAGLLLLAWSAAELAHERTAGVRVLRRLGVAPGTRVANTLAGALATPGALLLGDVVEELGGLDVPLGAIASEAAARQAWELIDRVEAEVLVVDPLTAPRLFGAAPAAFRPWWRGIVRVRTVGTVRPPAVPAAAGFAGWQRAWLAVPEVASFAAFSCSADRLHPDDGIAAEVLDEATGEPLPDGREGMLVLAARAAEPPLRYVAGLRGRAAPEPCPCGHPGVALELA